MGRVEATSKPQVLLPLITALCLLPSDFCLLFALVLGRVILPPKPMTRCFLTFLLSLISLTAWARLGYVETRGGKIFEGHVRFESNAVVVVNAQAEVYEKVAFTNIARMSLQSDGVFASDGLQRSLVESNGALPLSWRSMDVGHMAQAGSVEVRDGLFLMHSFGTNILAQADSFQFTALGYRLADKLKDRKSVV